MTTLKLKEIQEATGLSRQTLYKKYINPGIIPRISNGKYDAEKAQEVINEVNAKRNTVAPTKTGVAKDKLALLEEWGVIHKQENGRYTRHDIELAKSLSIRRDKSGNVVLSHHMPKPKAEKTAETTPHKPRKPTMSLNDMAKKSGMSKSTLLHYIRQGKIMQEGKNEYNTKSFREFLKGYENLKAHSYTKQEVIDKLGITNDEYLDLLRNHKLEKASFERYTKKSVNRLARTSKKNWDTKAPTYENESPKRAYTNRDLPEDELLTYKEVAEMLNRGKSTIVHLVKEGKIELVKRNRYSKESVEKYLQTRESKKADKMNTETKEVEVKPVEETPEETATVETATTTPDSNVETYKAKEVKELLGIKNQTAISYYMKKGIIEKVGPNKYSKESVDKLVEKRAAHPRKKRASNPQPRISKAKEQSEQVVPQVEVEEVSTVMA